VQTAGQARGQPRAARMYEVFTGSSIVGEMSQLIAQLAFVCRAGKMGKTSIEI
jgi:hypothetical protein